MHISKRDVYILEISMYMSKKGCPRETSIFQKGADRVDACGIASARIVHARGLASKGISRAFH